MTADLPDIRAFSAMLAKLHHDSMADPNAPKKFGYGVKLEKDMGRAV